MAASPVAIAPDISYVKSKLDEYFWEWLSLEETQKFARNCVSAAQSTDGLGAYVSQQAATAGGSSPSSHPLQLPSPPGSPKVSGHSLKGYSPTGVGTSPPRSPVRRTDSGTAGYPSGNLSPSLAGARPDAVTPSQDTRKSVSRESPFRPSEVVDVSRGEIPTFWEPKQEQPNPELSEDERHVIAATFEQFPGNEIVDSDQIVPLVTEILGLSKYFASSILTKVRIICDVEEGAPVTQQMFERWWAGRLKLDDPVSNFFYTVKNDTASFIQREDFRLFISELHSKHPGLEFLASTEEFQERYADTVICRIFFVCDLRDLNKIFLRDLRRAKPSIVDVWRILDENDDINKVREFFSYEHFYVLYCKFWELDVDHDFLLDREDLLRYDSHAFSRKAIDRIFSQIPAKFMSQYADRMCYEDFVYFLICEEDKTTNRSLDYWFRLVDLDGDGWLRSSEMMYFYEEQAHRLECLNHETVNFSDIMCQMCDLFVPAREGYFRLSDFKRNRKQAGIFFSILLSLNKFLGYEQRDPFIIKQDQIDYPDYSDWDRYCAQEYYRLSMEDGDEEEDESMILAQQQQMEEMAMQQQ